MAFRIWDEYVKKGKQLSVVELRDRIKELNQQNLEKQELEEKAREWAKEKNEKRAISSTPNS